MIAFQDKTWCSFSALCSEECDRRFTKDHHKKAIRWWGNERYPLAVANFSKKEWCPWTGSTKEKE